MLGILVIAMPIPIIVNSFTRQYQRLKPASKYWDDFQESGNNLLANNNEHIIGLYDNSDEYSSNGRLNGGIESPTSTEMMKHLNSSDIIDKHQNHDSNMMGNNKTSVSIEMEKGDHSLIRNTEL